MTRKSNAPPDQGGADIDNGCELLARSDGQLP